MDTEHAASSVHPIGLAADHAGFPLLTQVRDYLTHKGYTTTWYAPQSADESVDYPAYAHALARRIADGTHDRGIAICGTGNGISMALNRHRGIRAALCWESQFAQLAREHNDANVLSLPGRFMTIQEAIPIIEVFLTTPFQGGRHSRRIRAIDEV